MKYRYLRAWNRMLHSSPEYNVQRAIDDKAPENAIYLEADDVTWVTADDITNPVVKARLEQEVKDVR